MSTPTKHGRTCRACGGTLRYVSTGRCVACHQKNGRKENRRKRERENERERLKSALVEYSQREALRAPSVWAWRGSISLR